MEKRVLVIDDDENILEILQIIFADEGYEVAVASKAMSAEEISYFLPDLLILDIRLAGSSRNGNEICRELKSKKATCKIPVLLLSAEFDLACLAASCGADNFLPKPFDINHLLQSAYKMLSAA